MLRFVTTLVAVLGGLASAATLFGLGMAFREPPPNDRSVHIEEGAIWSEPPVRVWVREGGWRLLPPFVMPDEVVLAFDRAARPLIARFSVARAQLSPDRRRVAMLFQPSLWGGDYLGIMYVDGSAYQEYRLKHDCLPPNAVWVDSGRLRITFNECKSSDISLGGVPFWFQLNTSKGGGIVLANHVEIDEFNSIVGVYRSPPVDTPDIWTWVNPDSLWQKDTFP